MHSATRHIETASVRLRPLARADAAAIARLANDREVVRMTSRMPYPYRLEDAESFLDFLAAQPEGEAAEVAFAIEADGALAGVAGWKGACGESPPEIGYWLGRSFWGRGVATAAATAALTRFFSETAADAIAAVVRQDNPASARVLEKLGFRRTGDGVGCGLRDPDQPTWLFALTRAEWEAGR